ncbi:MAG: SusC/RagA family TonB-linked outer membrane protein, partial [Prevotella sp.]|nr:SusC/RagA family TonB-linked outer membrane protein [Prevotella sp.]
MSEKIKNVRYALVAMLLFFCAAVQAQTVKGVVKDATGETVIGATVQEQGVQNGVITDIDGKFSIKLKGKSHKLSVSYIGMKTKTVDVKDQSDVTVVLEDENNTLEDLVVVGYGTMKKKDLTGPIATVGGKVLEAVPVASVSEALIGKMAGVQVTTTDGSPDAEVRIRVRGGGSVSQSNDPLYIVDGFPVESISDIPASDIEDITALKDASSAAIYGSRAANGVILVTTKSGKAGKVNVSYNAYYSWKKLAKKLDVLDAYDYAKWQYELILLKNQGDLAKMSDYEDFFGSYHDMDLYQNIETNDWQDILYGRTGHVFNQSVNVNGGSEDVKYSFNYTHMNDKAILYGSSFKRDNFSLKLNTKPSKITTLDFQVRYADTDIRGGGANEATSTYDSDKRLKYAIIYTPFPIKNMNSSAGAADDDLGNLYNPIEAQRDNDAKKERKNLNISAAFGLEIIKNLK